VFTKVEPGTQITEANISKVSRRTDSDYSFGIFKLFFINIKIRNLLEPWLLKSWVWPFAAWPCHILSFFNPKKSCCNLSDIFFYLMTMDKLSKTWFLLIFHKWIKS
jgi:hypothetical protein